MTTPCITAAKPTPAQTPQGPQPTPATTADAFSAWPLSVESPKMLQNAALDQRLGVPSRVPEVDSDQSFDNATALLPSGSSLHTTHLQGWVRVVINAPLEEARSFIYFTCGRWLLLEGHPPWFLMRRESLQEFCQSYHTFEALNTKANA